MNQFLIFKNSELPQILTRKNTVMNFDGFQFLRFDQAEKVRAECLAGQVISPDHVDDYFCPFWGKKGALQDMWPSWYCIAGHLLRPQLISKWPNIVCKETLSYGKFHQPLLSTQLQPFPCRPYWADVGILSNAAACRVLPWSIPDWNTLNTVPNHSIWPTFCMK